MDPQRPATLYTQYAKLTYIPKDGKQVRKVFMPIGFDNHWFAVIVDLEKEKTFILNSLIDPNTQIEIREMVVEVVSHLHQYSPFMKVLYVNTYVLLGALK